MHYKYHDSNQNQRVRGGYEHLGTMDASDHSSEGTHHNAHEMQKYGNATGRNRFRNYEKKKEKVAL